MDHPPEKELSVATTEEKVRVLLDLAGITPTPTELTQLVDEFPAFKTRVESLWALDLGTTPPAMVFRAAGSVGPAEVAR